MSTPNQATTVPLGTIPNAYLDLGAEQGYNPRDFNKLRMLILGPFFEGKSTFVSGAPRTLILDCEDGAWGIPSQVNRAVRIKIKDHDHQQKIFDQLKSDAASPDRPFDRVVFDGAEKWLNKESLWLATQQRKLFPDWKGLLIEEWGMKGAGVNILATHVTSVLDYLWTLGYTWTVVGHLKETTMTSGSEERTVTRAAVYPSIGSLLNTNADVTAVIHTTTVQVPVLKQVKTSDGTVKEVNTGKLENTTRVCFDARVSEVGSGAGTGKIRGIALMEFSVILPTFDSGQVGWETVRDAYSAETARIMNGSGVESK